MCRQIDHSYPPVPCVEHIGLNIECLGWVNHASSNFCPIRCLGRALYRLTHCCVDEFARLSRHTCCDSNHRIQSEPLKTWVPEILEWPR